MRTDEQVKAMIREATREAISEALRGASIVDGPTHIAHHQAIDEFLKLTVHAKKTMVGAIVLGLTTLLVLGFGAWIAGHKG